MPPRIKLLYSLVIFFLIIHNLKAYVDICAPLLASIAYYEPSQIKQFKCNQCELFNIYCKGQDSTLISNRVYVDYNQKLQYYVLVKNNSFINTTFVYIVVRGTLPSQIQNWITNLNFNQIQYTQNGCQKCQVHEGFFKAYSLFKSSMISEVTTAIKNNPTNFNISIIGHSLGGAIATLAGAQIKSLWPKLYVSLITYGQPRVGDINFANFITRIMSKTQRNIHYADIVPHLPIKAMGYYHYNMEYWYDESMKNYKICIAENPTCAQSISVSDLTIKDHSMPEYYAWIFLNYKYKTNCQIKNLSFTFSRQQHIYFPIQATFSYSGFEIPFYVSYDLSVYENQEYIGVCESSGDHYLFTKQQKKTFRYMCKTYNQEYFPKNLIFRSQAKIYIGNKMMISQAHCEGKVYISVI